MKQINIRIQSNSKATFFLLFLNIFIFLVCCFFSERGFSTAFFSGFSYNDLILFGAKENGLIAAGQLYRLIFPMFLHANIFHLAVNMIGLWSLGRILEIFIGSQRILILYLVAGLTGNLFSFALIPSLSVGASGSLFGIFLCLYVVHEYQKKLAKRANIKTLNFNLTPVLLINIALNIVFGIKFPIFDWACHLGGSVAGIILGLQFIRFYKLNRQVFTLVLIALNLICALSYFRIHNYQKISAAGSLQAAQNKTTYLSPDELKQYEEFLFVKNEETKPQKLLQTAIFLQQSNQMWAAHNVYSALDIILKSQSNLALKKDIEFNLLVQEGLQETRKRALPSEVLLNYLKDSTFAQTPNENLCAVPAKLFMTLGFFDLSGVLYECAFLLNTREKQLAINALSSFLIAQKYNAAEQILQIAEQESEKEETTRH